MPTSTHQPRFLKGALVAIDLATEQRETIVFQYNPETVSRGLQPQTMGGQTGAGSGAIRFTGAPVESYSLEVLIDATDQLEAGDSQARELGILPKLAALEKLLYPRSQDVVRNARLLNQGSIEIGPYVAPLMLLVLGHTRVLPVMLLSLELREELFDNNLNPIRATVGLNMRALSYSDLASDHKGYHLFLTYQRRKEDQAQKGLRAQPGGAVDAANKAADDLLRG